MRIVFWQNSLSPHQLPYIAHLLDDARVDSVVIVAGEAVSKGRAKMGWEVKDFPGLERCDVYLNPIPQIIDYLFSLRPDDTWHLFSGIRGFQFVFGALKCSLRYKLKRGLIMELPNTFGFGMANIKPLWLHRLRFLLQDRKYASYFTKVFAMGQRAVDYYSSLYSSWQVYPFAYCTVNDGETVATIKGDAKFVFVGSLSPRKSPFSIIEAASLKVNESAKKMITIVGDGKERERMETAIRTNGLENISLVGTRSNSEIPNILLQQDILILPSLYDGWGAVVNEALSCGCYVICSDHCGAKALLIGHPRLGKVFKAKDYRQLAAIMEDCCRNIQIIRNERNYRLQWARQCISGSAVAHYMVDCLTDTPTKQPWI